LRPPYIVASRHLLLPCFFCCFGSSHVRRRPKHSVHPIQSNRTWPLYQRILFLASPSSLLPPPRTTVTPKRSCRIGAGSPREGCGGGDAAASASPTHAGRPVAGHSRPPSQQRRGGSGQWRVAAERRAESRARQSPAHPSESSPQHHKLVLTHKVVGLSPRVRSAIPVRTSSSVPDARTCFLSCLVQSPFGPRRQIYPHSADDDRDTSHGSRCFKRSYVCQLWNIAVILLQRLLQRPLLPLLLLLLHPLLFLLPPRPHPPFNGELNGAV